MFQWKGQKVPADEKITDVITIEKDVKGDVSVIAYDVIIGHFVDGLPIVGNGKVDQIVYTISTEGSILAQSAFWPSYGPAKGSATVLMVAEALTIGAKEAAQALKSGTLKVQDIKPAYASTGPGADKLTPAYILITEDGANPFFIF